MCTPKLDKGLGFKKLQNLKKALLAELAQKLVVEPNLFQVICLKEKYVKEIKSF